MHTQRIRTVFVLLPACILSACGENDPGPDHSQVQVSAAVTIEDCVRSCRDDLDAALESGNVRDVAKQLTKQLDDFEDFVEGDQSKQFEKLHTALEQLRTADDDESEDDLKRRVEEIRQLASRFLGDKNTTE